MSVNFVSALLLFDKLNSVAEKHIKASAQVYIEILNIFIIELLHCLNVVPTE